MSDPGSFPRRDEHPATIGRYRVITRLAADDVGEVFHAFDPLLERPVVVRVFHWPGLGPDETQAVTLRFFEQIQRVGLLVHPGIVPLFDAGDCPSGLFMASEYVGGPSLAEFMPEADGAKVARSIVLVDQLADAVDYAHTQGVAHLDLKPTNVRLMPDETLRVAAFGVASIVDVIRGRGPRPPSPYRAPECIDGRGGDHRADVYAVAAIAMDLVAGADPRATPRVLAERGESTAWPALVDRALAPEPGDRFQTSREFVQALAALFGIDRSEPPPAWDPFSAMESSADADPSGTDASASTTGDHVGRPEPADGQHDTLAASDGQVSGGDDLTVTKM